MAQTQPMNRGIVKQVLSGDSVVIRRQPRGGPPPERQLCLSNVNAPKLAWRSNPNVEASVESRDEPFAWEVREFLRKKLIGKEVLFSVEYKDPRTGREYGCIYLQKGEELENVTESIVSEGLVEVRRGGIKPSDDRTKLIDLEEMAKTVSKGKWGADASDHIRDITWNVENPAHFLDANSGKEFNAVIEHVHDGCTARAFLLPEFYHVTVMFTGIKCPMIRRDGDKEISEPFADEAKFFTESRLLQREVKVLLEGVSNQNFLGSIIHPAGNIAELLLREGFARCVDWRMAVLTKGHDKLHAAEKFAREKRLRMWKDYLPSAPTVPIQNKVFTVKVVECVNADALVIRSADGSQPKTHFSRSRLPSRWRDYKPCGVPIQGERIVAFKTLLSHQYDKGIKPDERFTPRDLVTHLRQKRIELGMVVDFTNTDRYYNSKELFDCGIHYRKIKCVGKKIPNENVVERFKTDVCTFLDKESNSGSFVGVHCTHGLNRSGYVVCRYLIECRGYTPEEAIKAFNKARGHDMERENYLEDLHKKIPKFDFTSYVCIGDNQKRDEIPFDRPRHPHSNSRYATRHGARHDAFEEEQTNWRSSNYNTGNTNDNDFRSRYRDQRLDRYQPPTGNQAQRRHHSEWRFRGERHRKDNHDSSIWYDNYDRTHHNPVRDRRSYSERNYNNYRDSYYYSNNLRGYDRGYYDHGNYASSSRRGRNREDSSRHDHKMRTTFARERPKPYTPHRKKRT